MNIYLTHARKAYSKEVQYLDDLAFPQHVHWFPESYKRVGTGMFYVPHVIADKVIDQELAGYIRENPVGKTAFILAAGNTNFAGINPRKVKETQLSYVYKFLPFTLTQVYAGRMAQTFGASDMILEASALLGVESTNEGTLVESDNKEMDTDRSVMHGDTSTDTLSNCKQLYLKCQVTTRKEVSALFEHFQTEGVDMSKLEQSIVQTSRSFYLLDKQKGLTVLKMMLD